MSLVDREKTGPIYADNLETIGVEIIKTQPVDIRASIRNYWALKIVEVVIVSNLSTGRLTLLGIADNDVVFASVGTTSSAGIKVIEEAGGAYTSYGGKEISPEGEIVDSEDDYQSLIPLAEALKLSWYEL